MRKIKKGDEVIVQAGKDKGRRGVVLSVLRSKGMHADAMKLLVEGVNLIKRHTKGNPQQEKPGGIIEKEASIAISNVAIFNQATGKADRVGFKVLEDGRKIRFFKSTGEAVDN
jgi:large subunit ribosomal protein L24